MLRWLCPFFLIGLVAANLVLVNKGIYGLSLVVGLLLGAVALLGQYLSHRLFGRPRAAADDDVRDDERRAAGRVFPVGDRASARRVGTDGPLAHALRVPCCCMSP